jgi:hypothetical protein
MHAKPYRLTIFGPVTRCYWFADHTLAYAVATSQPRPFVIDIIW